MTENDVQRIDGSIRKLDAKFDELALSIRVDTPWIKFKDHFRYGLNLIKEIPIGARACVMGAILLSSISLMTSLPDHIKKKLFALAADLIGLAFVLLGTP